MAELIITDVLKTSEDSKIAVFDTHCGFKSY